MSHLSPTRPLRAIAIGGALLLGVTLTPLVGSTSAAANSDRLAAEPVAATIGEKLLTVVFDGQDSTIDRGADFKVTGTVHRVTQDAVLGRIGAAVPAAFTLQVTDAAGAVLAEQGVTAALDGTFSTVVPGSVTAGLPASEGDLNLAVRAVDASLAGGYAAEDAGAAPVVVRAKASGLMLTNSFVSSVGWVKPGEKYPSTILVSNPTAKAVSGAKVVVKAPKGTSFKKAVGPGKRQVAAKTITWRVPKVQPKATAVLVITSKADTTKALPTIVWRDLSTKAKLESKSGSGKATSRGPKVIPPDEVYDTARYGDRPFPVVPVQYTDRPYVAGHAGEDLDKVINDPKFEGSTFNLFQEMSLGQLYPDGTVPSSGIATADFDYAPGFEFRTTDPATTNTCTGATFGDIPGAEGTPLYPERITNGVYNLPGTTQWYGADANGSAIVGAVGGVAALQQIDSGCGPTGKLVMDAAALSDPEIDYSDFDTDKDGLVDFFMVVFAGCGGNGASQLGACSDAPSDAAPYDNIWPHSSSLEFYYSDEETGQSGYISDDQLKNLRGQPLYYKNADRIQMTTKKTAFKVFVRVGPYNVNPETAIDAASVISHEYGHSLGLPDFYSLGGRETYGDWNLMATDKSHNMDAFSRQELGWVVPEVLTKSRTIKNIPDSKQDTGKIIWKTPKGKKYTLKHGRDGIVRNSKMYVAKLPGRQLLNANVFDTGDKASKRTLWWSGSGNDFGCATDNKGRNLDFALPALSKVPEDTPVTVTFKSYWDIEWDYDYGFVLTSPDGGETYNSNPSEEGYTTSNTDPTAGNPNQNGCQAAYDNGLTGNSASYDAGTQAIDRKAGDSPTPLFLSDTYDISELAGAETPVLRFSYSSDPGLARPGWFFDDIVVKAGDEVIYSSDFETSGGTDDPFVFNGGCKADNPGGKCTKGWQNVKAGKEAAFDHAYYLEMRDRSGFDLDGNGQIDRDPIGFQAGLYLSYTDEAHGYGNAGTDDPPAQSPLDANPEPGNASPDLNDASFRATAGRSTFSDFGDGHIDNYENPADTEAAGDVANPWRFAYDCLAFKVLSMSGEGDGPQRANGDLTGTVKFTLGKSCGPFNYGHASSIKGGKKNTKPEARIKVNKVARGGTVKVGQVVTFRGTRSTDKETPRNLQYVWSFGNGGSLKDANGVRARHTFNSPGTYRVRLTVIDPGGLKDSKTVVITVT
jgi:immune inhibitor A